MFPIKALQFTVYKVIANLTNQALCHTVVVVSSSVVDLLVMVTLAMIPGALSLVRKLVIEDRKSHRDIAKKTVSYN